MSIGIDYGNGLTNIDVKTEIRYGVIHAHEVGNAWYDSSEADYGEPHCPYCGTELKAKNLDNRLACNGCKKRFDDLDRPSCFYGDEPIGHVLDDGEYKASQGDQNDIFITKSPYFTRCEFCSPCAPGAGYLLNSVEDGVEAYCFGHDWFEDGKAPYQVFNVETKEVVLPPQKGS